MTIRYTHKRRGIVAGMFFILAAVTSIIGLLLYDPILHRYDYITSASPDEIKILWGALCEIILAGSVIGTSITLFPILKRENETMAIGTVCFRVLECMIIVVGIICLLTIVTLSHQVSPEANHTVWIQIAQTLIAIHDWTFLFGPNIFLGPSTFLTAFLLYKLKLVPTVVSGLGLFGGPLITLSGVLVMFGFYSQVSATGMITAIPVFLYEMSLAGWLIKNGFRETVK